ncbi:MAG TPA: hypothetical protein VJH23_03330 [archaeon]|nr:hypothetical protein [archaeon]
MRRAKTKLFIDERGQAFEPFKMLIGAIMALTVLLIIIGAIQYFENLRLDVSKQRFIEGISNAVRQPNGNLLVVDSLQFQRGQAFSSSGLGKNVGIDGECITFPQNSSGSIKTSGKTVEFTEGQQVDAYIKCDANPSAQCTVGCEISFNEPPE